MKKNTILLLPVAAFILLLTACSKQTGHIEGTISGAKDSLLYLDHMSLNGPVTIDSVKLGENGAFAFSTLEAEAPEFYRLRLSNQMVNLSIDSTETVTLKAEWPNFSTQYEVEGSYSCEVIKELTLKQMQFQNKLNSIMRSPTLTVRMANDSMAVALEEYKQDVRLNYILKEPMQAYAYYALFQTVQLGMMNMLIFNPRQNKDDVKVFAAVATSWDAFHPGAERGTNLHNIAIESMKNVRIVESRNNAMVDASIVSETGMLDITLTDNKGQERSLSELTGKVVILDFHSFSIDNSMQRIMTLRELYNKYNAQGLEIYQVGVDTDEHFWKTKTAALPWICVRAANAQPLSLYNVQAVPTFFIMNRKGELVKRDAQIKDLEAEIKSLL